jgi:hypothetical protein
VRARALATAVGTTAARRESVWSCLATINKVTDCDKVAVRFRLEIPFGEGEECGYPRLIVPIILTPHTAPKQFLAAPVASHRGMMTIGTRKNMQLITM